MGRVDGLAIGKGMVGRLTLMGSGETASGMVRVHRALLDAAGQPPHPVFLDTPAGFELGVDGIAARFVDYFHTSLGLELRVARYHRRDDPPRAQALALDALAGADYIIAGPGSPTYATEHLRSTPIAEALLQRWQAGAQLVFASAATISLGRHALPVYEIYKVGRPLYWAEGLDLLGPFGYELAIVPHWDNAEGGTHDTRACFMGMERFARLKALLPPTATVLGVDEHTAVTLDLDQGQAVVRGKGQITILRGEGQTAFADGDTFPLQELLNDRASGKLPTPPLTSRPANPPAAVLGRAATLLGAGDLPGGLRTAADGAPDDLAALLHQAATAAERAAPSDDQVGPLLEILIDLRSGLRERGEWALADGLRDRLLAIGIELRDTPEGTIWVRLP